MDVEVELYRRVDNLNKPVHLRVQERVTSGKYVNINPEYQLYIGKTSDADPECSVNTHLSKYINNLLEPEDQEFTYIELVLGVDIKNQYLKLIASYK